MIRNTIIVLLFFILLPAIHSCRQPGKKNSLSTASSPYLQEHADNPVDWYEWGTEALEKAKKENKPLLISIGYASCHWCHVMEKESFMDTAVARMMNQNFINIKVDREERPDIDNIYMNACQLITGGNGGWPLNAFALPDGKPFFAGTYYTKQGWTDLLKQIAEAYQQKNELVVKQAEALTRGIRTEELSLQKTDSLAATFSKADYRLLFDSIYQKTDTLDGGLKGSPKFPMPVISEFLLQYHYLTGDERALRAATTTLSKMAQGGIYDQVGGGFARYATDYQWKVPHFEKMLYDNAQLVSLYAHAYQVTGNEWFKTIVGETIGFVERDLSASGGAFYSSVNADTEEGEGEFYAWSYDEFRKIEPSDLIAEYYNVLPKGNWKKDRNILYASSPPASFAAEKGKSLAHLNTALGKAKSALLAVRQQRNKPATDTKVLASWNAMMLIAYADAYTATGSAGYLSKALTIAGFIEKNLLGKDGHLWRNYRDGKASIDGFLDDYAWVARAWIRLYQVSFDKHWLDLARQLVNYTIGNFSDAQSGMFFYAPAGSSLVTRKIEISDNVIPSSNAVMAGVLQELGIYFENPGFSEKSAGMFRKLAGKTKALTSYYAQWCYLAGLFSHSLYEIAIMGKNAEKTNLELQQHYLPNCIYMGETDEENLPLLENKLPAGQTLIYVCTNRVCKLPVESPAQALKQIIDRK